MKIAHLNVRSLYSKINEFSQIVNDLGCDVIGVTETWLDEDDKVLNYDPVSIEGFNFSRRDRLGRGGGCGIYVRDSIQYEEFEPEVELESKMEQVWIKFKCKRKTILIGTIYRPPNSKKRKARISEFITDINNILSYVTPLADIVVVQGDVNINLLHRGNPLTKCFTTLNFTAPAALLLTLFLLTVTKLILSTRAL